MTFRCDLYQLRKSKALRIQAKVLASKVVEKKISALLAKRTALRIQFCATYWDTE